MMIASDSVRADAPKILIVEDEQIVALELQDRIRRMGYVVGGHVSDGSDAIELARTVRPDLVLMDIKLDGELDGIDAAEAIIAESETPVVYLTAFADDATIERAKRTRPHGYVLKPIKELELRVTIDLALERYRAEKPRESQTWRQALLGSIADGIVATDPMGRVKYMNPVAEKMTGWLASKALGQPVDDVLRLAPLSDRRPSTDSAFQQIIARDGTLHPVEVEIRPVRDEASGASGFVWALRDMTMRKKLQDRQRFMEIASGHVAASFDEDMILSKIAPLIANNLADWCVIHMFEGGIARVKAIAHRDPSVDVLLASYLDSVVARSDGALRAVEQTRAPKTATCETPSWAPDTLGLRDGPHLDASSAVIVPVVARGRVLGTLTLVADRPERMFTEVDIGFAEELGRRIGLGFDNAHLCASAEHALRTRDDVIALISHDLRLPLLTVGQSANWLLRTIHDPSRRAEIVKQVEMIRGQTDRMNLLVGNLLDVSRIVTGRLALDVQPYALPELLSKAVALREKDAARWDIRLAVLPIPDVVVSCDGDRVFQILGNLLDNAIGRTQSGGGIATSAERDGTSVVISVESGTASLDLTDRVVEPLEQAFTAPPGTGLGLYMAKRLVEVHGGRLWVERAGAERNMFRFALPIAGPPVPSDRGPRRVPEELGFAIAPLLEDP